MTLWKIFHVEIIPFHNARTVLHFFILILRNNFIRTVCLHLGEGDENLKKVSDGGQGIIQNIFTRCCTSRPKYKWLKSLNCTIALVTLLHIRVNVD